MPGKPKVKQPANTKSQPKIGKVETILQHDEGASIKELVQATGWQPHTTRAVLTGLRKRGHQIVRTSVDGVTADIHIPFFMFFHGNAGHLF